MPLFWTIIILFTAVAVKPSNSTGNALLNDKDIRNSQAPMLIRFDPPEIDFGTWSIGVARSHKVTLVNENANRSVYLSSVSGRSPIFYSSFFESRVVPPLANTTFEVVFLPRQNAISSEYLLVHTSFGQARLLVKGEGFDCPYRLQPIVGIKAPLNALLTPEIYLYNPHNRPLQIVEVYSSGGQFQLELPSGLATAPQALWEIPPYTTKPVIRIKFQGNSAGNHTAYIRIKIAHSSSDDDVPLDQLNGDDVLVVPVEFEITPEQGIYAANPVLEFGRITNTKQKKPLQLNMQLRNSNELRSSMSKVGLAEGESLITGLRLEENDGIITLDAHLFNKTISLDEVLKLEAKSEDNKSVGSTFTVRVRADIFKGTLHYNRNTTVFITGVVRCKEGETRTFNIRNDFEIPLSILSANIERNDSQSIQVHFASNYHDGLTTLQPGESFDLAYLQLVNISVRYQTQLLLRTNITNFEIPIVICSGRLHITTFNEPILIPGESFNTELNMGTVPLSEMSQDGYIVLYNPNPIAVKITNWNFKSPQGVYFHTTSMGCLRPPLLQHFNSNKSVSIESSHFRFCSQLGEGDILVFEIAIQSHVTELSTATLHIWTPYENIITSIVFHTWIGKLEVDQELLYFKDCYPGKVCTAELSIYSTFQHPIHLTSINFTSSAIRFENEYSKNLIFALTPNAATRLGRIFFEPAIHCQNRCYLPLDDKQNFLAFPSHSVNENNNYHVDEIELRRRTELYRQMKWYFRDISFIVRSRELRQMHLQAFVDIEWPKLVKAGKYKFPNTESGRVQEMLITIRNPTEKPLLVDYYLSDPDYAPQTKLSLPLEVVAISSCYLTDKHVFSIPKQNGLKKPASILLPPHGTEDVLVRFEATSLHHQRETFCTLLHIRNNLTLYEAVWLSARVVQSQFRFGNRKPGSSTPLLYDLQDKHISACPDPVVAKRTFTARNTGEVPIWIETFLIDNQECEGYGFKVFGCGNGFELKTNQSRKIEIAFRPDFTASRVTRLLTIRTNLSYSINYTLHAQLPPTSLLEPCMEGLQRPLWEDRVRIAGVFLLVLSFVLVVAAAHVDSETISQAQSALYIAREKGPVHPTFNLRNIAIKSSITTGNCSGNTNSNSNGRNQNKSNNQNSSTKTTNQNHQKKRALVVTGGGGGAVGGGGGAGAGNHVKKYQPINASSSTLRNNLVDVDPFIITEEHGETTLIVEKKSSDSCDEVCSKAAPPKNENSEPLYPPNLNNDNSAAVEINNESTPPISAIQKTSPLVTSRIDFKKQKTPPPLQSSMVSNISKQSKAYTKGKSKSLNQFQITTPPPAQNPIIELMDKEIVPGDVLMVNDDKYFYVNSNPATEKSSAPAKAAISSKPTSAKTSNDASNFTTAARPMAVTTTATYTKAINTTTTTNQSKLTVPILPKASKIATATATAVPVAVRKAPPPIATVAPSNIKITSQSGKAANSKCEGISSTTGGGGGNGASEKNAITKTTQKTNIKYGKMSAGRERRKEKRESYELRGTNATSLSAASSSSSLASTSTGSIPTSKRSEQRKEKKSSSKSKTVHHHHVQTVEEQRKPAISIKNENIQPPKAPPHSTANNINSLFEVTGTQKVSLNDILEVANKTEMDSSAKTNISSLNTSPVNLNYQSPLEKAIRHIDLKEKNVKPVLKSAPFSEPILNGGHSIQSNESYKGVADLGPIGSKKSPSSTPVWESVGANFINSNAKVRAPLQPKPTDSNSFFSSYMDTSEHSFDYNNSAFMEGISTTDLYELRKAQAELRRQLSANEYLLKIRQQQLKDQLRRQQKHQQDMLHSLAASHWPPSEEANWSTLAFDTQHRIPLAMNEDNITSGGGGMENLSNHWQTASPVRPPPGLGVTANSGVFLNGGITSQQPPLAHNNNTTKTNAIQKEPMEETRVFDPFSSLSSIWSNNWNQLNKKDDNGSQGYQQ